MNLLVPQKTRTLKGSTSHSYDVHDSHCAVLLKTAVPGRTVPVNCVSPVNTFNTKKILFHVTAVSHTLEHSKRDQTECIVGKVQPARLY
jgi:hypothetical protein